MKYIENIMYRMYRKYNNKMTFFLNYIIKYFAVLRYALCISCALSMDANHDFKYYEDENESMNYMIIAIALVHSGRMLVVLCWTLFDKWFQFSIRQLRGIRFIERIFYDSGLGSS